MYQTQLKEDDKLRERYNGILTIASGSAPDFAENGTLVHARFRWIGYNWFPTWLSQDGSADSLQKLHELARQLNVRLTLDDGFLLFPSISVMSEWSRNHTASNIEAIQAHLERRKAYRAAATTAATTS